jgi:beta-phosphoglucomutase family hydrolase
MADDVPVRASRQVAGEPGPAGPDNLLPLQRIDAVIFDMDGVVTDTARTHAHCWKKVFDAFLRGRGPADDPSLRPFDEEDYLTFVDGKPRYDGVQSFLASRNIALPLGSPSDPPGDDTVCALGNLKDHDFEETVRTQGVEVFESTIDLIRRLRSRRIGTALISSSRHAKTILGVTGTITLFDVVVDGVDTEALSLAGKPDPAIFLTAAQRLHIAPERATVVEDALAGVEAGKKGGFGYVVGVDRSSQAEALRRHGADTVVSDLSELVLPPGDARRPVAGQDRP